MRKTVKKTLILAVTSLIGLRSNAQPIDSATLVATAKRDVKLFQMNDEDYKKFKKDRKAFTDQYKVNSIIQPGLNRPFPNPITNLVHNKEIKEKLNKTDYYSGFFEPSLKTTSDTALLKDSVYVRAFRDAAYKSTVNDRTITTVVLAVGGGVLLLIGLVAFYRANIGG